MSVILSWIVGFLKIVIVLGTLITIHELGHFTVAKLCKVKVNKFAIGFGPKLFCKQHGETEYTIRLLPFGGFCQMEGEEERSEDENAFNKKSVWQRIAIVFAGPFVNIIFALIVYFFIAATSNYFINTTVLDLSSGPLYEAGILPGDKIISINGDKVLTQREIETIIEKSKSDDFVFVIERNNIQYEIPVKIGYEERGYLGVAFSDSGDVLYIYKKSPAYKAGIELNDTVISFNQKQVSTAEEIVKEVRSMPNSEVELQVIRSGELLTIKVNLESTKQRFFNLLCEDIHPNFLWTIVYSLDETWYYLTATVEGTFGVLTGQNLDKVEVMGPIGIAGEISGTKALSDFFYLMSAISLSLGIFNLLPIPALDGGRILIFLIEAIRRKQMSEKLEQRLILAGFILIILIAICITASDVIKLF